MSDAAKNGNIKGSIMGILTAAGILVGAVSLTYALTGNALRPRVDLLESQTRELMIGRAETNTKLDALTKSVDRLVVKMEAHMEGENR